MLEGLSGGAEAISSLASGTLLTVFGPQFSVTFSQMKAWSGMEKCRRAFGSQLTFEEMIWVYTRELRCGGRGTTFALQLLLIEDLRIEAHFAFVKLDRTGHLFRLERGRRNVRMMCLEEAPQRVFSVRAEELKNDVPLI